MTLQSQHTSLYIGKQSKGFRGSIDISGCNLSKVKHCEIFISYAWVFVAWGFCDLKCQIDLGLTTLIHKEYSSWCSIKRGNFWRKHMKKWKLGIKFSVKKSCFPILVTPIRETDRARSLSWQLMNSGCCIFSLLSLIQSFLSLDTILHYSLRWHQWHITGILLGILFSFFLVIISLYKSQDEGEGKKFFFF